MTTFVNTLLVGLGIGAMYALIAMGFNVIFATTGILNFAQGDFFMLGAMSAVIARGVLGLPLVVALVIGMATVAVLAVLEERIAIRPATRSGHGAMGWVLGTLGVSIVLRAAVGLTLGPDVRPAAPILSLSPLDQAPGGVRLVPHHLMMIAVTLLVGVGLQWFYRRSRLGLAFGAVAQDAEAAAVRGLPVARLSALAFALSGALTAAAGLLAAPLTNAYPAMGFPFALNGFVAAALGGIPEIRGAMLGGFLLGAIEALGVSWFGAGYRHPVVFVVLLAVLMLRPQGLLGRGEVRPV